MSLILNESAPPPECLGFFALLRGHSLSTFPPVTKLKQDAVLSKRSVDKSMIVVFFIVFIIYKSRPSKAEHCFTICGITYIIHTRTCHPMNTLLLFIRSRVVARDNAPRDSTYATPSESRYDSSEF